MYLIGLVDRFVWKKLTAKSLEGEKVRSSHFCWKKWPPTDGTPWGSDKYPVITCDSGVFLHTNLGYRYTDIQYIHAVSMVPSSAYGVPFPHIFQRIALITSGTQPLAQPTLKQKIIKTQHPTSFLLQTLSLCKVFFGKAPSPNGTWRDVRTVWFCDSWGMFMGHTQTTTGTNMSNEKKPGYLVYIPVFFISHEISGSL